MRNNPSLMFDPPSLMSLISSEVGELKTTKFAAYPRSAVTVTVSPSGSTAVGRANDQDWELPFCSI